MSVFHVTAEAGGRWGVMQEGSSGASNLYDSKNEALTVAIALAKSAAPSVVKVHGLDGTVEDERSYGADRDLSAT
jgi:hypothetical protein